MLEIHLFSLILVVKLIFSIYIFSTLFSDVIQEFSHFFLMPRTHKYYDTFVRAHLLKKIQTTVHKDNL